MHLSTKARKIVVAVVWIVLISSVVVIHTDIAFIILIFATIGYAMLSVFMAIMNIKEPPIRVVTMIPRDEPQTTPNTLLLFLDKQRMAFERDGQHQRALDLMLDIKQGRTGLTLTQPQREEVQEHIDRLLATVNGAMR